MLLKSPKDQEYDKEQQAEDVGAASLLYFLYKISINLVSFKGKAFLKVFLTSMGPLKFSSWLCLLPYLSSSGDLGRGGLERRRFPSSSTSSTLLELPPMVA